MNWAFNYYDLDDNNYIDSKELKKVLHAIYKMMGVENKGEASSDNKAMQIFTDLDLNNDRKVGSFRGHFCFIVVVKTH